MGMVIINPGSGPVEGATLAHAHANMDAFVRDLEIPGVTWRRDVDAEEDGGRFSFLLAIPGYTAEHGEMPIDMPGIPLDEVRYLGAPGQNIWHFPRLYVDGSSYVWKFAISVAQGHVADHTSSKDPSDG